MGIGEPFVRTESFEATIGAWAVADDAVALLTDDGAVHVVDSGGRTVVEIEETVHDVAIAERVYVIGEDRIAAYSRTGTALWSGDIGGRAVAAPETDAFVVALTDGDELVGFDAESGEERFRTAYTHADVAETAEIVCTGDRLVLGAWSFLSVYSSDGELRHEQSLDGAIDALGVVGETIVCALKDGRVVGVDLGTGDRTWSGERTLSDVDPHAHEALLVRTEEGLYELAPDGRSRRLGDDPGGTPIAAAGGDPVCLVLDGTVTIHRRIGEGYSELAAEVDRESLDPDAPHLPVTVTNEGESTAVSRLVAETDGLALAGEERTITLAPGESEHVGYPIATVDGDVATVRLRAGDRTLLSAELPIAAASEFDAAATLERIRDGGAELAVELSNPTTDPITGLTVEPTGEPLSPVGAEEAVETTISVPLDAERVELTDGERTIPLSESLPAAPLDCSIGVAESGLVEVRIENSTTVPVADRLSIDGDPIPSSIERELELPAGSVATFLLSPVESGSSPVRVESATFSAAETVAVPADAVPSATASEPSGRSDATADEPDGDELVDLVAEESAESDGIDAGAVARRSVDVDREFSTEQPTEGRAFGERIAVRNRGTRSIDATVESDGASVSLDAIEPGEERVTTRWHVPGDDGGIVVSPVDVTVLGERVHRFDERRFVAGESSVVVDARLLDGEQPALSLSIDNREAVEWSVETISLEGVTVSDGTELPVVEEQSSVDWSTPVERDGSALSSTLQLELTRTTTDGTEAVDRTLAPIVSAEEGGLRAIESSVRPDSSIGETRGVLELSVRNAGDDPIHELTVEATGELPDSIMYGGETIDTLSAGEEHVHEIDLRVPDGKIELPIELAAEIDGEQRSERLLLRETDDAELHERPEEGFSVERARSGTPDEPTDRHSEFRIEES